MSGALACHNWRQCCFGLFILAVLIFAGVSVADETSKQGVDTALVVSVDVSNSVDDERYRLQMEGVASALEDPGVLDAILSGPRGGILFSMVTWADRPQIVLPWRHITSAQDARVVAAAVRKLPRHSGHFTCMARMLRTLSDKVVTQVPMMATRVIIDVSGDGPDNCNSEEPVTSVRDELVAAGVTVNGLPILEDGAKAAESSRAPSPVPSMKTYAPVTERDKVPSSSLEAWYRENVIGGPGSFILPAYGYSDFGRAIRQKFVIEISGLDPSHSPARSSIAGRARTMR